MSVPNQYLQELARKFVSGLQLLVPDTEQKRKLAEMALRAYREVRDEAAHEEIFREEADPEIAGVLEQIDAEPVFFEE